MKHIGDSAKATIGKLRLRPRFTVVHHPVREKFGLTMIEYALIDSIDQLSHRPDHPWCTVSKNELADFLDIARRTVFNTIKKALAEDLIEKNDRGDLRTTRPLDRAGAAIQCSRTPIIIGP